MNGRNVLPPDKGKSINSSAQDNELNLDEIEMKQEPDIKPELKDVVDMVTVSASEHTASGSIVNLIGGEQTGDTYDFTNVYGLDGAKSELKKKKIEKEAEKDSTECSEKGAIGSSMPNDSKNNRSNKNQKASKPTRGPVGSKKAMKSAAITRNKPKASIRINKKKSTTSKREGKQHKCSSCDYTTSHKGNLNKHQRKHTGEKPFSCTHCAKRFTQKSNHQLHMRTHVSDFLFSCSNCWKGFTQSDEKVKHEISCKIRRYECHLCKELFTFQKTNLEYHMRVHHTGEKPFGCNQCSKKFTKQFELKSHMKTHIIPRSLKPKCSVCYRNFSQRIAKDEHETKCKRRGYKCHLCKEFTSNFLGDLKRHMLIHTGVQPFQCETCKKSFSRKPNLAKHINRLHKKTLNIH